MKVVFAFLLIVFLAFSGYHLTFRSFRLPLFARKFYLTGSEFLLLGFLLGPEFMNILDSATLRELEPLIGLLLGWIGLLAGFQFEFQKIRRFPREYLWGAFYENGLSAFFIFIGCLAPLVLAAGAPLGHALPIALTLTAAGVCTSQTGLALLAPGYHSRHSHLVQFLRYLSSMSNLTALFLFALVFHFPAISGNTLWFAPFFGSLGISLILLLIFMLFLAPWRKESELLLIVIGMAVIASGAAPMLAFSPLVVSFLVGMGMANLARDKERIYTILSGVEKPVYLLVLLFLGVNLRLDSLWLFAAAGGYFLCRAAGKIGGGFLMTCHVPAMERFPGRIGLGFLDQSGLPLAILLNFQQSIPLPLASGAASLTLMAIILNDLVSPLGLKALLGKDHA